MTQNKTGKTGFVISVLYILPFILPHGLNDFSNTNTKRASLLYNSDFINFNGEFFYVLYVERGLKSLDTRFLLPTNGPNDLFDTSCPLSTVQHPKRRSSPKSLVVTDLNYCPLL